MKKLAVLTMLALAACGGAEEKTDDVAGGYSGVLRTAHAWVTFAVDLKQTAPDSFSGNAGSVTVLFQPGTAWVLWQPDANRPGIICGFRAPASLPEQVDSGDLAPYLGSADECGTVGSFTLAKK